MAAELSSLTGLVLHFRTPEHTLACLRSLIAEGIRRAVVVDNSEDAGRSVDSMRGGLNGLRDAGLDVSILGPGRNLGFAGGVSAGLEQISRRWQGNVLLINSDAQLESCALQHMCKMLDTAECVAPYARAAGQMRPASPLVLYQPLCALYLRRRVPITISYLSGTCLLIHQNLVGRDLFDQDFFFYGEDVMLGFDLARRGVRVAACEAATVLHAGSASARNGSIFYEYHMNRAHWLLARKLSRNGFERVAFVAMRCITLPSRGIVRSVRFRSLIPLRGLLAATIDVLRGRCRSFTPPA